MDSVLGGPPPNLRSPISSSSGNSCDISLHVKELKTCTSTHDRASINYLTVNNVADLPPRPYIFLRGNFNSTTNLNTGSPPIVIDASGPLSTYSVSGWSSVPGGWVVGQSGTYKVEVTVQTIHIILTGTTGQPPYQGYSLSLTSNSTLVDTTGQLVSLLSVPTSTETFLDTNRFVLVGSFVAGDILGLSISTVLSVNPPNQGLREYSVHITQLG